VSSKYIPTASLTVGHGHSWSWPSPGHYLPLPPPHQWRRLPHSSKVAVLWSAVAEISTGELQARAHARESLVQQGARWSSSKCADDNRAKRLVTQCGCLAQHLRCTAIILQRQLADLVLEQSVIVPCRSGQIQSRPLEHCDCLCARCTD